MVVHKVEDKIRSLELAVIESALALRSAFPGKSHPGQVRQLQDLVDAVDALNDATKPDPWELLTRIHNGASVNGDDGYYVVDGSCMHGAVLYDKIDAALKWYKENP